ncbi:MAG: ABC transporter ATP-binding protein [Pseudomonadota bacterium]
MDRSPLDNMPLVHIKNMNKVYQQGDISVNALADINLEFRKGEFTALVGPSGSGKTTLLNLIGALDKPSSGAIALGGQQLADLSRADLAELRLRKIGFIFQDYNLLPVLSALENVEYILLLQGVPAAERRSRADTALKQVGLDGCQQRRPAQLSGGQQQRVAIARAIAAEPLLVLADEPTANLDSETGAALIDTMLELNRNKGTTFIFSTHDEMIMRHATRIVRLKDGKIVEDIVHAIH